VWALAWLLILASSALAQAQEQSSSPQRFDETAHALAWLEGRFRSPVTCLRSDGSRLELEQAIGVRAAPMRSGMPVLRVTFFGIDVPDAEKCFNVVEPRVPDRRGVLYVTYRSNRRPDMGLTDFRRTIRKGSLVYHIVAGQLRIRNVDEDGEPRVVRFEDRDYPLHIRPVLPHSDGDRLLAPYRGDRPPEEDPRRRLRFEIEGPESFTFVGAFIEEEPRRR
jgi:hypothetical protein